MKGEEMVISFHVRLKRKNIDKHRKAVEGARPYHCFLYSPGETPSVFRKIREK